LRKALNELWKNSEKREKLSRAARENILTNHVPRGCADQYFLAIEDFEKNSMASVNALVKKISKTNINDEQELVGMVEAVSLSIPPLIPERQLFVDVSELVQRDSKSGIQRVVKNILHEWIMNPPQGVRIEPVYATENRAGYCYARQFMSNFLNYPENILSDDVINYQAGDVFIGLDLQPTIVVAQKDFYQQLRRHGVKVQFVVYDLLCILMPQHFVEGGAEGHNRWLEVVAESDGVICISKAVADEVDDWMKGYSPERLRPFNISWFHLGADIENSMPTQGLSYDASKMLKVIQEQSSFLMVGTIEPRKGHAQTLAAFEQLWADGVDVSLVIVGKQGWMVEGLVERLQHHSELGKRLFWLEGISDEYLEKTYAGSTCLVAASEGEGFGLPLIEAAQYKLPIIARDIPVFREVAGEHAYYFNSKEPEVLAVTIKTWLKACKTDEYPSSESMLWLTWRDSAKQLMDVLLRH
jgi:glycosyltransferase involved in cell wall biosynthesis